ncbi:SRPBCC family protein [Paenibacillus athensensis]|uniref:Polyketide cyclase n=1 Tax=Paenibacillus athensensis TaxID=1967502 RepID=A0A4Y8QA58_9BACL|nr:SRPBCC family protein [Paenibacillus athensensis]MCD1257705.1 SRPBCC family protein [Paenibacillus athensensis]
METNQPTKVTVQAVIQAPVEKVWRYWSEPEHITKWNQASEDWHAPRAENDLRVGGKFVTRMEAKDGSMGFEFGGVYDVVNRHEAIGYAMEDGRRVDITFVDQGNETEVIETFDAENSNPVEFQQAGWQAILNNFKAYTEQN